VAVELPDKPAAFVVVEPANALSVGAQNIPSGLSRGSPSASPQPYRTAVSVAVRFTIGCRFEVTAIYRRRVSAWPVGSGQAEVCRAVDCYRAAPAM
jgi:hypothetical protein